jgi:hypothetical protein
MDQMTTKEMRALGASATSNPSIFFFIYRYMIFFLL